MPYCPFIAINVIVFISSLIFALAFYLAADDAVLPCQVLEIRPQVRLVLLPRFPIFADPS